MCYNTKKEKGDCSMAEYKKQHYVPKLYLQNFTIDNVLLSVYNISQSKSIPKAPYDTQCYKDYYYGKDKIWEKQLGKLEVKWGPVFQRVLAKKPLYSEDIYLIKQFALYQLQRTVAMNDYMEDCYTKEMDWFLIQMQNPIVKNGLKTNALLQKTWHLLKILFQLYKILI